MPEAPSALDFLEPGVLFLAVFVAVILLCRTRAPDRLLWRSGFYDIRRFGLFSHPLEASVVLVALPLIYLLPARAGAANPAAAVLVSAFSALVAADYLRAHYAAVRVMYAPEGAPCPVCALRQRRRERDARLVEYERAERAAEGRKGVTP